MTHEDAAKGETKRRTAPGMVGKHIHPEYVKPAENLDRISSLESEIERLKATQATCCCGSPVIDHNIGSGHSPQEMPEECPYHAEVLDQLRQDARALAEILVDPHGPYDTEACEDWCNRRDALLSQPQIQKLLE